MDDIGLNKIATVEKCIGRINEEYIGFEGDFYNNFSKQDCIILNIQRTAQACIDLAMHIVRIHKLGLPQNSRDIFILLAEKQIISNTTSQKMQKMVGFRNIAVHDYQALNIDIVIDIINHKLLDFKSFTTEILEHENK